MPVDIPSTFRSNFSTSIVLLNINERRRRRDGKLFRILHSSGANGSSTCQSPPWLKISLLAFDNNKLTNNPGGGAPPFKMGLGGHKYSPPLRTIIHILKHFYNITRSSSSFVVHFYALYALNKYNTWWMTRFTPLKHKRSFQSRLNPHFSQRTRELSTRNEIKGKIFDRIRFS